MYVTPESADAQSVLETHTVLVSSSRSRIRKPRITN